HHPPPPPFSPPSLHDALPISLYGGVCQPTRPLGYSNPVSGAVQGEAAGAASGYRAAGPVGAVVGGAIGTATGTLSGTANMLSGRSESTRLNSSHVSISYAVFC